jgi:hypothetical protein
VTRKVPPRVDRFDIVLADASAVFRFFEAGATITEKLMNHCGGRLHVVDVVDHEIDDHVDDPSFSAGIAAFRQLAVNEPVQLEGKELQLVDDARRLNEKYQLGGADLGEYASVLYAEAAVRNGTKLLFVCTDREGLTRANGAEADIPAIHTQDFLAQLVHAGVFTVEEGETVFRTIFATARIEEFHARLDDERKRERRIEEAIAQRKRDRAERHRRAEQARLRRQKPHGDGPRWTR